MIIYSIYRAINLLTNKVYIGFDSKWPKRKHQHKFSAIYENDTSIIFYNAIRKYGWENFSWEVIYQSLDKEHTLKFMEPFFIKEYNSYVGFKNHNGYNMTIGGDGCPGMIHSVKTKQKHRVITSKYHKNLTTEERNKRSKNCSYGQLERYKLKSDSEITKSKKKKAHQGKYVIISPEGSKYFAENGLKEFGEKNNLGISYWQLFNSYRKCKNSQQKTRPRKNGNNWIVLRTDKE